MPSPKPTTRPLPKRPVPTTSREEYWTSLARKPKRVRANPEFDSQSEFIRIVRHPRNVARCPDLEFIYANGNGGMIHKAEAGKRRAEGVLAGVSDLTLPAARHGFGGLYIENKSPVGTLSKEQKRFRDYIVTQNYCFKLCRTADEQCDVIDWYLGIKLDRFTPLVRG